MREGNAPLVRREDYAAPPFWIRKVDLTFELDPAKTMVINRMQIERNGAVAAGPLKLHGDDITLTRCLANGESVSFRHEDGLLVIDNLPEGSFTLEIRNTCAPERNTRLSGLYTSSGGFFTQCEAEGFRRITYFLDRPDVMAEYTVTMKANKAAYPVLLSNGNLVEQGDLDNGRHFAKWHDPFAKPSYLFALVAADLVAREQHIRSRAGKDHLLQVYVRRGDLDKTEHAMSSLVASVVWDEARFGLTLDLERFMIVAVGDFNMGAMENKGLNIFNTKYILANAATATDADFEAVESVVGHEYFHNWTGNRITCRDWFQLSLKEGLTVFRDQEFSMDMVASATARAVKRISDVRNLRQVQFAEDAGPMAHPVRPDSYVEINNFYTPTVYEKGAEVVRMMQTLVGRDGFARGMKLYFERFDGQAVTCDDFAQSIADANPESALARLLPQFKRWYGQAGTPRVTARGRYDAPSRTYTLGLEQAAAPGSSTAHEPFVIPLAIGLVGRDGQAMTMRLEDEPESAAASSRVLVLDEARTFFTFVDVDQPPVLSLLRGFSAPVILVDGLSDADLLILLGHDNDPVQPLGGRSAPGAEPPPRERARGRRAGARRRRFRHRHARRTARSTARPGVQGARPHAAERVVHRRAARERRSAAHPRRARSDEARSRQRPARRLGMGVREPPGERRLLARPGVVRAARARQPRPGDAVPRCRRAFRDGLAGPRLPALQGRLEHDRPAGRARRAAVRRLAARRRGARALRGDVRGRCTGGRQVVRRCRRWRPSTTARCSSASRRCCAIATSASPIRTARAA